MQRKSQQLGSDQLNELGLGRGLEQVAGGWSKLSGIIEIQEDRETTVYVS